MESGPLLSPAFVDGMESFRALAAAYRGEAVEGLTPPKHPSLVNCAAALAGGEAIAIAGTQEAAATWKAWFDSSFPSIVLTTLEWPTSTARVKGLLHVRAGAVKSGVQLLKEAIRWSEDAGYAVEAALAQLQLAEILDARRHRFDSQARCAQIAPHRVGGAAGAGHPAAGPRVRRDLDGGAEPR